MDSPPLSIPRTQISPYLSSLLLLLLLVSLSPSNAANSSELLDSVCAETINYTKCLQALGSVPRTHAAKSLKDLAKISLHLAISNAKESLVFLRRMLKTRDNKITNDTNVVFPAAASIEQCVVLYGGVIASLRSALVEVSEDAMTANYDIKTAGDGADGCENELVSRRVRLPSVSDRNYQLKFYSNIGDVITNKL